MQVRVSKTGEPVAMFLDSGWLPVHEIRPPWQVDQLWWRSRPVNRLYYQVAPDDGPPLTIFHDLISDEWYRQAYS